MTAGQPDQPPQPQYAVVELDHRSDAPGVYVAEGPYGSWAAADTGANEYAIARGLARGTDVQVCQLHAPGTAPRLPDTITFVADGVTHTAVVGPPQAPRSDGLTVEHDGTRYGISIALGTIPDYPGVGYVARPVQVQP